MCGGRRNGLRQTTVNAAFCGALLWSGGAAAEPAIGGAKLIENDVRGEIARETTPIHRGDQVFQDEWVRTAAASLAQLVLRDESNVSLGPSSQIKLDRFVYDGAGSTAKRVLFDAGKGVFRFFSGNSPHDAYQVTTPQATIGVRGTIYDVEIAAGRTRVVLQEGAVRVCARATHICKDLTQPGTSVVVERKGITGPLTPAEKTWDFGEFCGESAPLCNRTTLAGLDLALPGPRTRHAALPAHPRAKRTPIRTAKRPVRRTEAAAPAAGTSTYPPVVGAPVIPFLPFLGGRLRGGFGGRGGGAQGGGQRPPPTQDR